MTKSTAVKNKPRNQYTPEFREQALTLADTVGVAQAARRFKATTDSNHSLPIAPNLLNQHFIAENTNQKWVGDITYLWTEES